MKDKLSLNCRRWGWGGGGGAASVEGVFLCVADRTTGECGKFQSRVDGIVGGCGGWGVGGMHV